MAVPYVPRAPTAGVLHDVVRRHLTTFTADGALAFHPAPPPTRDAVRRVVAHVRRRVVKVLAARGIDLDGDAVDPLAEESLALAGLGQAAVRGRAALGCRAGRK